MRKLTIYFQLCLMVRLARMRHPGTDIPMFQVEFMTWNTFREAMLNDVFDPAVWTTFARAHCVVGGVDTTLSYL
jgi:hypothetical protein